MAPGDGEQLAQVAALVSSALGRKEICLGLDELRHIKLKETTAPEDWATWLLESGRVSWPGGEQPLILDGQRLYLSRYWHYEDELARALLDRASRELEITNPTQARASLERLFPQKDQELNRQKLAAALALLRPLLLISGGPGTGKTHTVAAIIALLLEQDPNLRVGLAAPTGKAAARLSESLHRFKTAESHLSEAIRALIPDEARTLHRLLGMRPGRVMPRHGPDNPLHLDLLVVDESSMIDLPLMHKTLMALAPEARLILLGDRDQLASVEAGSVYADLCGDLGQDAYNKTTCKQLTALGIELNNSNDKTQAIDQCRVQLKKSWRFDAEGDIGKLAFAVRDGRETEALELLDSSPQAVEWQSLTGGRREDFIRRKASQGFAALMQALNPKEALKALEDFRILCALRQGSLGVEAVNLLVEDQLRREGLIRARGQHYQGRPLMVTHNDPGLGLFNGDIGLLWSDDKGQMRAWFQLADGSLKALMPNRLPPHETAWALSVHKSQGSEFTQVLLLLPDNADNPLLTRELLYTGISRAREKVSLLASRPVISAAISRQVQRASGLGERLRPIP